MKRYSFFWHNGRLSQTTVALIGAVVSMGGLVGWALIIPLSAATVGEYGGMQALCFAVSLGVAAIPAHRYLSGRRETARSVAAIAIGGDVALTVLLLVLPAWFWPFVLVGQGVLTAIAATTALLHLRAAAGSSHSGRVLGAVAITAVVTASIIKAIAGDGMVPAVTGLAVLPLLAAVGGLRIAPVPATTPAARLEGRTFRLYSIAISALLGIAGALTVATSLQGGNSAWRSVFGLVGLLFGGVLLDAGRHTTAIAMGAGAAVLSRLTGPLLADAIGGLAQGLLLPIPWYLIVVAPQGEGRVLLLAAGQSVLWGLWQLWPGTAHSDGTLVAAAVALAGLTADGMERRVIASSPAPDLIIPITQEPPASAAELLSASYAGVLTPRELQLGQLAVLGVSSREIAGRLFLSESTVKTHLKSLYRKTETTNRNDLYRRLMDVGSAEELETTVVLPPRAATLASAERDAATGLLGRQAFNDVAAQMIVEHAQRRSAAIVLIKLQMEFGSQTQREALTVVAGILQASLRTMDVLFHYDAVQFVVILPGSDGADARLVGDRLAQRVRAWAGGRPATPTLAMGWASTDEGIAPVEALLAKAAERMATLEVARW